MCMQSWLPLSGGSGQVRELCEMVQGSHLSVHWQLRGTIHKLCQKEIDDGRLNVMILREGAISYVFPLIMNHKLRRQLDH